MVTGAPHMDKVPEDGHRSASLHIIIGPGAVLTRQRIDRSDVVPALVIFVPHDENYTRADIEAYHRDVPGAITNHATTITIPISLVQRLSTRGNGNLLFSLGRGETTHTSARLQKTVLHTPGVALTTIPGAIHKIIPAAHSELSKAHMMLLS